MEKIFKDHCGPDVQYLSHERVFREIKIQYKIPSRDTDRVFTIRVHIGNGLQPAIYRAVLRAADHARIHAYHATGKLEADTKRLLQGRLVVDKKDIDMDKYRAQFDEYPRSDAQAAEVSPTAAIDPEP